MKGTKSDRADWDVFKHLEPSSPCYTDILKEGTGPRSFIEGGSTCQGIIARRERGERIHNMHPLSRPATLVPSINSSKLYSSTLPSDHHRESWHLYKTEMMAALTDISNYSLTTKVNSDLYTSPHPDPPNSQQFSFFSLITSFLDSVAHNIRRLWEL